MKTRYTFACLDIFSTYFLVILILLVVWAIYFIFFRKADFSFLNEVMLNLKYQPIEIQLLAVKIQKLLRWLAVINAILLNFFIVFTTSLYGPEQLIGSTRHYVRIRYLTSFNYKTLLELHQNNQFDINSVLAQAIKNSDNSIKTILYHTQQPFNYSLVFLILLVLLSFLIVLACLVKPRKLSLLLVFRIDIITSFLTPFLFFGILTFVISLVFQTFFVQQFLFFFSKLNKFQKLRFLKNLHTLLLGLLVTTIFFPLILGCIFFYIQAIEIAQVHHLYEVQQVLHHDMQTVLLELLEKQKLYSPGTIEHQNITKLIADTSVIIENQRLILDLFEIKYSFSTSEANFVSYRYVIVVRKLISGLFGLGFLVLMYKAYQLSNIKK